MLRFLLHLLLASVRCGVALVYDNEFLHTYLTWSSNVTFLSIVTLRMRIESETATWASATLTWVKYVSSQFVVEFRQWWHLTYQRSKWILSKLVVWLDGDSAINSWVSSAKWVGNLYFLYRFKLTNFIVSLVSLMQAHLSFMVMHHWAV